MIPEIELDLKEYKFYKTLVNMNKEALAARYIVKQKQIKENCYFIVLFCLGIGFFLGMGVMACLL